MRRWCWGTAAAMTAALVPLAPGPTASALGPGHSPPAAAAATAPAPRASLEVVAAGGWRLALPRLVSGAPPSAGRGCRRGSRVVTGGRSTMAVTSYDQAGHPVLRSGATRAGEPTVLVWRFDARGRLLGETYLSGAAVVAAISYEYSKGGRHTTASHDNNGDGTADAVFTYDRDTLGRLERVSQDQGADGRPELIRSHEYDLRGHVQRTTEEVPGLVRAIITYTWRTDLLRQRQVDVTGGGELMDTTTYSYDGAGRLVREVVDASTDGSTDTEIRYTYDPQGHLAARHRKVLGVWRDSHRFTTDGLGRLTGETFISATQPGYTKTVTFTCRRVLRSEPRRPGDDAPPGIDPVPEGAGPF